MPTHRDVRRQFGHHVTDNEEFADLWADYEHLRGLHADGHLKASGIGLALRKPHPDADLKPAIVLYVDAHGHGAGGLPVRSLNGFPVHIEDIGPQIIESVATDDDVTDAFRQAYGSPPGGVSTATVGCGTSGTLGCFASSGGKTYLISNRHVLDALMNGALNVGVQQQSAQDGNTTTTAVATTKFLGPLANPTPSPNTNADVGAALMGSVNFNKQQLIAANSFAPLITPNTIPMAQESVRKSGRTTGQTAGVVDSVTAQVNVSYSNGATYTFDNCIGVANPNGAFQQGGDSGALLVNAAYQPVGLMMSASSGPTGRAFAMRIAFVLAALNTAAGVSDFTILTGSAAAEARQSVRTR